MADPRTLASPATPYVLASELETSGKSITIRGAGARKVAKSIGGCTVV